MVCREDTGCMVMVDRDCRGCMAEVGMGCMDYRDCMVMVDKVCMDCTDRSMDHKDHMVICMDHKDHMACRLEGRVVSTACMGCWVVVHMGCMAGVHMGCRVGVHMGCRVGVHTGCRLVGTDCKGSSVDHMVHMGLQ